ncbi:uncharacterized protein N7506_010550 [Penicillium brevicompactum]|uniref:uncharacterized protein n=1 Tax=Penicillium brevicompactum TaxID=5074 RepID=UPI002541CDEE|nr:uncharacterized protein N7506_010550 [Penicillium brevicompactum]KAJ5327448.1 hypothetical protein N7506_010550 [Penicillium brevicompactum]
MDLSPRVPAQTAADRGVQACEMCHRKKTKCEIDRSSTTCIQCIRRGTHCVFPTKQEKREDHQGGDDYVQSLKERLVRIESLLKTAGILQEGDVSDDLSDDEDDADCDIPSPSGPPTRLAASLATKCGDLEGTPIFRADERDDSRYFGKSCSLSILSRTGIEWIKSKTGDVSFLRIVSPDSIHDNPWNQWRPDVFHDLFASQVFKPLPSRSEVFSLMKDFFRTANRLFPIYLESSFMKMVEWQYTQQTCDDAARWASINMVISLAYEYRYSSRHKSEKDKERAELYFKNAMSVFTELALKRTDLLSIQALISMAFFLRGNSGTQSALPLITAAMRSGQRMGLHRDIARPDLSPAAQEERRRVFWVAFVIDQSTCLRIGNAPSQHPDDFDVPLPEEMESDRLDGSPHKITFFRQMCRMSVIKGRIYSRLYSAKALLRPPIEIYRTVKELHAELEEWNLDSPPLSEHQVKIDERDFLYGFASLGLRFVYHNALIMIHRVPLFINYIVTARNEPERLQALSKAHAAKSGAIGTQSARDTLKLINNMPWGDIAWTWSLLYYVFLAATTIFSAILRDTRHPHIQADLQSLTMASTFFATLTPGSGPNNYAGFMTRMSATLERIARVVVEKDGKRAIASIEGKEQKSVGKKRRNSLTTHTPRQYQPANPHLSMPPTASSIQAPNTNQMNIGIPDTMEGFPPVNSSGYVVPMSPSSALAPNPEQQFHSQAANSALPVHIPAWQLSQDFSTTPSTAIHSPESFSSTNPIPDFFQVPMSGDWDYSGNLFAGLFPTEYNFPPPHPAPADAYPSMPILSAESFMTGAPAADGHTAQSAGLDPQNWGYGFATEGQEDGYQGSDSAWSNGFLGLF